MSDKPVILISSAGDANNTGDARFNGGVKVYNNFANLLIENGYEAYVVTWTGERIDWLIHHAPYISIDRMKQLQSERREFRYMTGWWWSEAYLSLVDKVYFYDCEITFTCDYQYQRGILEQWLNSGRIAKLGVHSRTEQAYYQATYGLTPDYIPEWHSEAWVADASKRIEGRIGYMHEGDHTEHDIDVIRTACAEHGLYPEFVQVSGDEAQVLATMQTLDLYVALNAGKHAIYGEGCPRSPAESMRTGAVLVAYEVFGNAYYAINEYTAFVEPRCRPDMLAGRVIQLLQDKALKETMRARSIDFAQNAMDKKGRLKLVKGFLHLD